MLICIHTRMKTNTNRSDIIAHQAANYAWSAGERAAPPSDRSIEEQVAYRARRFGHGVTELLATETGDVGSIYLSVLDVVDKSDSYMRAGSKDFKTPKEWATIHNFNDTLTYALNDARSCKQPLSFTELEASIAGTYNAWHSTPRRPLAKPIHNALIGMRSELAFEDCLKLLAEQYPGKITFRRSTAEEESGGADFFVNNRKIDVKSDEVGFHHALIKARELGRDASHIMQNPVSFEDFEGGISVATPEVLRARATALYRELIARGYVAA